MAERTKARAEIGRELKSAGVRIPHLPHMKGETVFDIVDTGKDSRIKITDERGTQARLLKR